MAATKTEIETHTFTGRLVKGWDIESGPWLEFISEPKSDTIQNVIGGLIKKEGEPGTKVKIIVEILE